MKMAGKFLLVDKFREENPDFPSYIVDELEKCLPKDIGDSQLKKVLENVLEEYENSLVCENEAIGVITAQSVGEPSTQMTLNVFHFAGVASHSVEGLPRLIEILDLKKTVDNPQMRIYVNRKGVSEEEIRVCAEKIRETRLSDLSTSSEVNVEEKQVKIGLDLKAFKKLGVEGGSIISYLDKKIKKGASVDGKFLFLKGSSSASLKDLMGIKELALSSVVFGIKGIRDVSILTEGEFYVIVTQGIALNQVRGVEEFKDALIYCNNIDETFKVYGIEAARQVIIREIMEVVKSQGLSINERHVLLIADAMTYRGEPRGMTRHGIVAQKMNVLTKASFETPLRHLGKGALMNEVNDLNTITENVMTNQIVNVGTGIPKISVKKGEPGGLDVDEIAEERKESKSEKVEVEEVEMVEKKEVKKKSVKKEVKKKEAKKMEKKSSKKKK